MARAASRDRDRRPRSMRALRTRNSEGAPQAKQVADRFHLLQNLRESIERQMSNVSRFAGRSLLAPVLGEHNNASREARRNARKSMFDRVQNLHAVGKSL